MNKINLTANLVNILAMPRGEIIDYANARALPDKRRRNMRSNETGPTSNQSYS